MIEALDDYHLLPHVLHNIEEVDCNCSIMGQLLTYPFLPVAETLHNYYAYNQQLCFLAADKVLTLEKGFESTIPLLAPEKMGVLMPKIRKLVAKKVPALALDITKIGSTTPFGSNNYHPKTREDLAELRTAADCPLWLYGVASPRDAEVAAEAGLEAIIVNSDAFKWLNAPPTIEIFPEIFDAVAGIMAIYAGGPVRHGIDVFRYLAIGAEAVVINSDRLLPSIKAELEYAMRLTGCKTLADIGYEAIYTPLFSN